MNAPTCTIPVPEGVRYEGAWPFSGPGPQTVHLFTDLADTKSTLGIYERDLSEQKLAAELAQMRAKFAAAR